MVRNIILQIYCVVAIAAKNARKECRFMPLVS